MSDVLEWYARLQKPRYDDPAMAAALDGYEIEAYYEVFARVMGVPGAVVWQWTWEPQESGASAPNVFPNIGPVAVGQVVDDWQETWGWTPTPWTPNEAAAVGVSQFGNRGTLTLTAKVDGVSMPGKLIMTIAGDYDGLTYVSPGLSYEGDVGPEIPPVFWTQHQNTYEIP